MDKIAKFGSHDYHRILPFIRKHIERYEINVSTLCAKLNFNRSTFYYKLYGDKIDLDFVVILCNHLGIKFSLVID